MVALSIGFFSNVMGLSYGYLMGAYLVGKPFIDKHDENAEITDEMNTYLLIEAIGMAIPFFLHLAVLKNEPKIMPNAAEEQHTKLNMKDSLKKCFLNYKNILVIFSLSLYLGNKYINIYINFNNFFFNFKNYKNFLNFFTRIILDFRSSIRFIT